MPRSSRSAGQNGVVALASLPNQVSVIVLACILVLYLTAGLCLTSVVRIHNSSCQYGTSILVITTTIQASTRTFVHCVVPPRPVDEVRPSYPQAHFHASPATEVLPSSAGSAQRSISGSPIILGPRLLVRAKVGCGALVVQ